VISPSAQSEQAESEEGQGAGPVIVAVRLIVSTVVMSPENWVALDSNASVAAHWPMVAVAVVFGGAGGEPSEFTAPLMVVTRQ
jgi:hypothetical protein